MNCAPLRDSAQRIAARRYTTQRFFWFVAAHRNATRHDARHRYTTQLNVNIGE